VASLEAIRDAVQATLDANLATLSVYDAVPDAAVNVPAVVVMPLEADFNVAMARGVDTWTFDLLVLAPYAVPSLGQDSLDSFVTGAGDNSIRQVIFTNRTLGLTGTDAHVSGMSDYGAQYDWAQVQHVGARLALTVVTSGTE
jgi:hypothetical protein